MSVLTSIGFIDTISLILCCGIILKLSNDIFIASNKFTKAALDTNLPFILYVLLLSTVISLVSVTVFEFMGISSSELSRYRVTTARFAGGYLHVLTFGLNTTSSRFLIRRTLALDTPSTNIRASIMLLLPEPFLPTIALNPRENVITVGFAKLLKFFISTRLMYTTDFCLHL